MTATPLALSLLLAIGIDAGLVACELGAIVGDGRAETWCNTYVGAAVILSVGLNGYSSAAAAPEGFAWLSAGLGGTIPMLVYVAARGAAYLWRDKAAIVKPAAVKPA